LSIVRLALISLLPAVLAGCQQLDSRPNVGPCPVAGVLYDAQRLVEVGSVERHENVGYTGQVEGVTGFCRYVGPAPITMELEIDFAFGRGPQAQGNRRTYDYFVAVTRRDRTILAKERFSVDVVFPAGKDTVYLKEILSGIEIPRATETVSGTNFEIIVGFELTPEQLAYNRSGKRFRMNTSN
jgi:hypothetical protein